MLHLTGCGQSLHNLEQQVRLVLPTVKAPTIQRSKIKTDLPDYGPEKLISVNMQGQVKQLKSMLFDMGVLVSFPADMLEEPVRVAANNIAPTVVLQTVLSQFENDYMVIRRSPDTYLVGKPESADLVVRVFTLPDADLVNDAKTAIATIGSEAVEVSIVGDRAVVKDTVDGMRRIELMFNALLAAEGQYIVEVQFIELSRSLTRKLGIDWNLSGVMQFDAGVTNKTLDTNATLSTVLQATIEADENQRYARLLTSATLSCIEGKDAQLQTGQTIPVPQRTVTDQGTVTTTGYQDIDTGLLLTVGVTREPDGLLRVSVEPELSQVSGYIDEAPIRTRRVLRTAAVIAPGGVIIVGGSVVQNHTQSKDGLPYLSQVGMDNLAKEDTRIYVVLRVISP
ncbi:MAG: type II secretion system protein GspD [Phycisphaeraceae bacterium JB051]